MALFASAPAPASTALLTAAARGHEERHQRQRHPDHGAAADELAAADVARAVLVDDVVLELAPPGPNGIDLSLSFILAHSAQLPSVPLLSGCPRYRMSPDRFERSASLQQHAARPRVLTRTLPMPSTSVACPDQVARALHVVAQRPVLVHGRDAGRHMRPTAASQQRRERGCAEVTCLADRDQLRCQRSARRCPSRRPSCSAARKTPTWMSSCPAELSICKHACRSGEQAVLGGVPEHRLVHEDEPGLAAGIGRELVREAGEAAVQQAVQSLLAQVPELREPHRERVEPEAQRLRVEVPARVEALGLVALGVEVERAVGDRAQLAADLRLEPVDQRRATAPWTCGRTRNDTGLWSRSPHRRPRRAARASCACTRSCPGSPLSRPIRAEYGRSEPPTSAAVSAPRAASRDRAARGSDRPATPPAPAPAARR